MPVWLRLTSGMVSTRGLLARTWIMMKMLAPPQETPSILKSGLPLNV
jgi:hypothetical protein